MIDTINKVISILLNKRNIGGKVTKISSVESSYKCYSIAEFDTPFNVFNNYIDIEDLAFYSIDGTINVDDNKLLQPTNVLKYCLIDRKHYGILPRFATIKWVSDIAVPLYEDYINNTLSEDQIDDAILSSKLMNSIQYKQGRTSVHSIIEKCKLYWKDREQYELEHKDKTLLSIYTSKGSTVNTTSLYLDKLQTAINKEDMKLFIGEFLIDLNGSTFILYKDLPPISVKLKAYVPNISTIIADKEVLITIHKPVILYSTTVLALKNSVYNSSTLLLEQLLVYSYYKELFNNKDINIECYIDIPNSDCTEVKSIRVNDELLYSNIAEFAYKLQKAAYYTYINSN